MIKINYHALREIAKQATQGEWVAFISPGKYGTYAVHTPGDNHHGDIVDWPGFDEQKNAENNARYIAAFNPVVVQALLDELEAKDKRIADMEAREVVLPRAHDVHPLGMQSAKIFCEFHRSIVNRCADEIRKVGVKVSIKGN
ncbi:TPA: ead/Ea22-like family protein [Escherichia coli]|nr:ead/Ea22-like family protein [Escherichia coli]